MRQVVAQARGRPTAKSKTVPSPIGGLNARDALAEMPPTDAIILDNWFPRPTWVEIRGGETTLATFTGICETVAAYNGLLGLNQLFAGVINGGTGSIYRVDNKAGGSAGSAVVGGGGSTIQAVTGTRYDWTQFGTGSAEVLYLVNGLDQPLIYDGTTWYSITTVSAPYALTGGPSPLSSLNQIIRYKSRLWFVQANSFNVYYLPQNVFAGALTLLNMAPNFNMGGYIAAMATNSVDNAAGINDYLAFISNQGEVVMFQGYDPASVNTWSEAGHFMIGRPLATGRRTWCKIGSDAAILSADGVVPLSKALVTDRSQQSIAITDKIRNLVSNDVAVYGNTWGWQTMLYPEGNKLIVNVPTQVDSTSYQYVQNTLTGAWCTFGLYNSSWNAQCFERMGSNLYLGTTGSVQQCDTGLADGSNAILATAKPAFNYMDEPELLKQLVQAQLIFQTSGTVQISVTVNVDFDNTAPTSTIPISTGNTAVWNVSLWSTPTYWGDATQIAKPWIGMAAVGYSASAQIRISAMGITSKWQSIKYLYKSGSQFYG